MMLSEAVNRHIELYRSMGFKYRSRRTCAEVFAVFAPKSVRMLDPNPNGSGVGGQCSLGPPAP
jgi:hypothetical protein